MVESFETYWHGDQAEPRLLLEYRDPSARRRRAVAAAAALGYQVLVVLGLMWMPAGVGRRGDAPEVAIDVRRAVPLTMPKEVPPFRLTQREPQRAKASSEVDLAALVPQPEVRQEGRTPAGRTFTPPPGINGPAQRREVEIEAPRLDVPGQGVAGLRVGVGTSALPPPPQPAKVTNPFERVGGGGGAAPGRIAPPKASVEEAVRGVAASGGGRGTVVSDMDVGGGGGGGLSSAISQLPASGRNSSALELLSDPQGTDFKPYLIQVLAAVKRNWLAVFPESARLGRQGRVAIQFSIDRAGRIPKLVIAMPSGTEALDRAAVAGISAANPLPPLPAGFRGGEVRLQLVFSYNMPR